MKKREYQKLNKELKKQVEVVGNYEHDLLALLWQEIKEGHTPVLLYTPEVKKLHCINYIVGQTFLSNFDPGRVIVVKECYEPQDKIVVAEEIAEKIGLFVKI